MKKIINRKVYDTDTAVKIGDWNNGQWENNLYICVETLYRKKNGEFFIHGEGGAATKYASVCNGGDGWASGEGIVPMSYKTARDWAEEHLGVEEYEAAFGDILEDDSKTMMSVYLTTATAERVKRAAQAAGMTVSAYVDEILTKAEAEKTGGART